MKLLSLKNVSIKYNTQQILKDVSFDMYKGEIFGFLGPNGAGKSTTIEIITGLKKQTSGAITFCEKKLIDKERYRKIGVQLQSAELYDDLTVKETLLLFLSFHNRERFLNEHISLTNLESFINQRVKTLSGGQRQRLSLSLSLVNNPDLVILDEPTAGLDPQSRRLLWTLIENLKKAGKAILLTTHFMDEAQMLCDRVAIINEGKLLLIDTVDNLLSCMKKRFTITVKTSHDITPNLVLDDQSAEIFRDEQEVIIKTNELASVLNNIVKQFSHHQLPLQNIIIKEANLEDLFIQLTGKELRE